MHNLETLLTVSYTRPIYIFVWSMFDFTYLHIIRIAHGQHLTQTIVNNTFTLSVDSTFKYRNSYVLHYILFGPSSIFGF